MGDGKEDMIDPMRGGREDFALMAGGAKPAIFAGESEVVLVVAVIATNTVKAAIEDTAVEVFFEDI
jgi:hypothetical protein